MLLGFALFLLIFFPGEVVVFPDVHLKRSFGHIARVKNHIVDERFKLRAGQVGAGGLQRVEEEAGDFAVELARDEQAHDLHERNLDGVGIFEDGQVNHDAGVTLRVFESTGFELVEMQGDALFVMALVEVTETIAAQGGRSALRAVDFEVLTAIGIRRHKSPLERSFKVSCLKLRGVSPSPSIYWNVGVRPFLRFDLWAATI